MLGGSSVGSLTRWVPFGPGSCPTSEPVPDRKRAIQTQGCCPREPNLCPGASGNPRQMFLMCVFCYFPRSSIINHRSSNHVLSNADGFWSDDSQWGRKRPSLNTCYRYLLLASLSVHNARITRAFGLGLKGMYDPVTPSTPSIRNPVKS